jgi:hypothetical protein
MNLKAFNTENCVRKVNGQIALHVSKAGGMSFSAIATVHLDLHPGDGVEFFLDETAKQWYVAKSKSEKAFIVRKEGEKNAKINSATVTILLMQAAKATGKSARFLISKDPIIEGGVNLYPVITRNLLDND